VYHVSFVTEPVELKSTLKFNHELQVRASHIDASRTPLPTDVTKVGKWEPPQEEKNKETQK